MCQPDQPGGDLLAEKMVTGLDDLAQSRVHALDGNGELLSKDAVVPLGRATRSGSITGRAIP